VHLYFCLPPYLFATGLIKNTAFAKGFAQSAENTTRKKAK